MGKSAEGTPEPQLLPLQPDIVLTLEVGSGQTAPSPPRPSRPASAAAIEDLLDQCPGVLVADGQSDRLLDHQHLGQRGHLDHHL
jgi:hypothetical protein